MRRTLYFIIVASLCSCQPQSYEDFREKGRSKTRSLIAELKHVRTKDQLIVHEPKIQKGFANLAELMEEARHFRSSHPDLEPPPLTGEDKELSDQLRLEILRVSRLEGGREILSQCRSRA
jgi:hypothetical protein